MKSFTFRAALTGVVVLATLLFVSPAWATFPGTNGQIAFAALPTPGASGKQIFTIEPNGTDLRQITHPDGTGVRQLTSGTGGLFSLHPTWSPDSSQLLFLRGTSDPNLTDIWSINVDGSQLYQVTHQPAGYGTGQALACLP